MAWFSLVFWCSSSIVLMLWAHGLKVQGALAFTALFFSILLIKKRNLNIVNARVVALFAICLSPFFFSVLWSHDLSRTSYELLKIFPGIFGVLALSQLLRRPEQLRKMISLNVVTACVTVLFAGTLIYMFGSLRGTYRGVTELRGISGILASYAQLFVPIGICLVVAAGKRSQRILAFILTQCCLVLVIYSSTRAAMLAMVVSLVSLSLGVVGVRRYGFRYCSVLLLLVPLTFFAVRFPPTPVVKQELQSRVEDKMQVGVKQVTQESGRLKTWKRAIKVYSDNPVAGVGFEAFSRKYWYTNPHNIVLDCILGAGVAGLLGMGVLFFCSVFGYVKGIRVLRRHDSCLALYAAGLGSALVGVFVYGMFWQILWHPFFYLLSMVGLFLGINLRPGEGNIRMLRTE